MCMLHFNKSFDGHSRTRRRRRDRVDRNVQFVESIWNTVISFIVFVGFSGALRKRLNRKDSNSSSVRLN